jgi:pimeloyl-ACP methyl ester carboxylesterase
MELKKQFVTTKDGRQLEFGTIGNESGKTVVFHHGTPGCLYTFMEYQELINLGDFFVIAYTRAGYGESSRDKGRSIASVVDDVRQILDSLGRDSYVSVGWSGGGPHSLACAALDAPRCTGALSVAGVAPRDSGFDWTEGMGPENIEEFELALKGGPEYEASVREAGEHLGSVTADNVTEAFGGLMSEADKASWIPLERRERQVKDLNHAFKVSADGFQDDDQAFIKAWGFSVSDIKVPTSIWFGGNDLFVPKTHGDWLTNNIDDATVRYFEGDGHMSIWFNNLEDIAKDISSK